MTSVDDSRAQRLLRWQAGETPGPWEVQLFFTNRCNLQCGICWQRWAEKEFGGLDYSDELPDERWLELVDEGAVLGAREWILVGGGEPMARAELVLKLAERIRGYSAFCTMNTNGTMFKPKHIERLVQIGFSEIVFSLDGPTPEINDAIRSPGAFEKTVEAIRRFTELKRRYKTDRPRISTRTVITRLNYSKLDEMIDLFHGLGCDGAMGLSALTVQGDQCKGFELEIVQLAEARVHIERALARTKSMGIANNFHALLEDGDKGFTASIATSEIPARKGLFNARCFEPWLGILIHPNGKVCPCCVGYDDNSDSVREKPLADVWLGAHLQALREQLAGNKAMKYCRICPGHLVERAACDRAELNRLLSRETGETATRVFSLPARFAASVRARGIRRTLRRGWEWTQIRVRNFRCPRP